MEEDSGEKKKRLKLKKRFTQIPLLLVFRKKRTEGDYLRFLYGNNTNWWYFFCFLIGSVCYAQLAVSTNSEWVEWWTTDLLSGLILASVGMLYCCKCFVKTKILVELFIIGAYMLVTSRAILRDTIVEGLELYPFKSGTVIFDLSMFLLLRPRLIVFIPIFVIVVSFYWIFVPIYFWNEVEDYRYIASCFAYFLSEFLILVFLYVYGRINRKAFVRSQILKEKERRIKKEHEKSVELLKNILPVVFIKSILEGNLIRNKYVTQSIENGSILLSDIVNFTVLCSNISSEDVVSLLDQHFGVVDELCKELSLEKVKTIGDAALVIGGLRSDSSFYEHFPKMVLLGLAIIESAVQMQGNLGIKTAKFECRVGIASGNLHAVVFGDQFISFDVFGKTVNQVYFLEEKAQHQSVHVSNAIYQITKDEFNYTKFLDDENGYLEKYRDRRLFVLKKYKYGNSLSSVCGSDLNDLSPLEKIDSPTIQEKIFGSEITTTNEHPEEPREEEIKIENVEGYEEEMEQMKFSPIQDYSNEHQFDDNSTFMIEYKRHLKNITNPFLREKLLTIINNAVDSREYNIQKRERLIASSSSYQLNPLEKKKNKNNNSNNNNNNNNDNISIDNNNNMNMKSSKRLKKGYGSPRRIKKKRRRNLIEEIEEELKIDEKTNERIRRHSSVAKLSREDLQLKSFGSTRSLESNKSSSSHRSLQKTNSSSIGDLTNEHSRSEASIISTASFHSHVSNSTQLEVCGNPFALLFQSEKEKSRFYFRDRSFLGRIVDMYFQIPFIFRCLVNFILYWINCFCNPCISLTATCCLNIKRCVMCCIRPISKNGWCYCCCIFCPCQREKEYVEDVFKSDKSTYFLIFLFNMAQRGVIILYFLTTEKFYAFYSFSTDEGSCYLMISVYISIFVQLFSIIFLLITEIPIKVYIKKKKVQRVKNTPKLPKNIRNFLEINFSKKRNSTKPPSFRIKKKRKFYKIKYYYKKKVKLLDYLLYRPFIMYCFVFVNYIFIPIDLFLTTFATHYEVWMDLHFFLTLYFYIYVNWVQGFHFSLKFLSVGCIFFLQVFHLAYNLFPEDTKFQNSRISVDDFFFQEVQFSVICIVLFCAWTIFREILFRGSFDKKKAILKNNKDLNQRKWKNEMIILSVLPKEVINEFIQKKNISSIRQNRILGASTIHNICLCYIKVSFATEALLSLDLLTEKEKLLAGGSPMPTSPKENEDNFNINDVNTPSPYSPGKSPTIFMNNNNNKKKKRDNGNLTSMEIISFLIDLFSEFDEIVSLKCNCQKIKSIQEAYLFISKPDSLGDESYAVNSGFVRKKKKKKKNKKQEEDDIFNSLQDYSHNKRKMIKRYVKNVVKASKLCLEGVQEMKKKHSHLFSARRKENFQQQNQSLFIKEGNGENDENNENENKNNGFEEELEIEEIENEEKTLRLDRNKINIKIGIHVGSVSSGVVGSSKFIWDLWGDSLNVSARLSQTSGENKAHLLADVAKKYDVKYEKRGITNLKGKGEKETGYVLFKHQKMNNNKKEEEEEGEDKNYEEKEKDDFVLSNEENNEEHEIEEEDDDDEINYEQNLQFFNDRFEDGGEENLKLTKIRIGENSYKKKKTKKKKKKEEESSFEIV